MACPFVTSEGYERSHDELRKKVLENYEPSQNWAAQDAMDEHLQQLLQESLRSAVPEKNTKTRIDEAVSISIESISPKGLIHIHISEFQFLPHLNHHILWLLIISISLQGALG